MLSTSTPPQPSREVLRRLMRLESGENRLMPTGIVRGSNGMRVFMLILLSFSSIAAWAHNLKAAGSNPAPATKKSSLIKDFKAKKNARILPF
ncbi:hypothetical protein [Paracoccus aminovorans]|uniref:hypothetical protein n=1 Tax=Paracoccus aminovorans TaxID=34004 RepID=UPI0012E3BE17|nr:hypothetical protein [Paracoccus aminovorans]